MRVRGTGRRTHTTAASTRRDGRRYPHPCPGAYTRTHDRSCCAAPRPVRPRARPRGALGRRAGKGSHPLGRLHHHGGRRAWLLQQLRLRRGRVGLCYPARRVRGHELARRPGCGQRQGTPAQRAQLRRRDGRQGRRHRPRGTEDRRRRAARRQDGVNGAERWRLGDGDGQCPRAEGRANSYAGHCQRPRPVHPDRKGRVLRPDPDRRGGERRQQRRPPGEHGGGGRGGQPGNPATGRGHQLRNRLLGGDADHRPPDPGRLRGAPHHRPQRARPYARDRGPLPDQGDHARA